MQRERKREGRVYVYQHRTKWKVEVRRTSGKRATQTLATREEADAVAGQLRRQLAGEAQTMSLAIEEYLGDMRERGCKEAHVTTTEYRLCSMFTGELLVAELTANRAQSLYDKLREKGGSVDTQRNTLAQSRTFCKWATKQGYLRANPFADVEGVGRRSRGKKQLTIDESRKLMAVCLNSEDVGATATLCCLLLGLRAGEVADITTRSIDDEGRILRVDESKTDAGIRLVEVPEVLRPRLLTLAEAPKKTRHWVATRVRRWCKLADVTEVGPHALRGTHASLATRAGASSQLVAATLGHTSATVTEAHYTQQSATDEARQGTVLKVLAGGKR